MDAAGDTREMVKHGEACEFGAFRRSLDPNDRCSYTGDEARLRRCEVPRNGVCFTWYPLRKCSTRPLQRRSVHVKRVFDGSEQSTGAEHTTRAGSVLVEACVLV